MPDGLWGCRAISSGMSSREEDSEEELRVGIESPVEVEFEAEGKDEAGWLFGSARLCNNQARARARSQKRLTEGR